MRCAVPTSLGEALSLLADAPSLRPLAGCTDLMVPGQRSDLTAVLDLSRVAELRGIAWDGDQLKVGAMTTFAELQACQDIVQTYEALYAVATQVGGWQIQTRATLGGNIANASPAGDALPVLLALDAELELCSCAGMRRLPYRDFHLGYRKTALRLGELISAVRLPRPPAAAIQRFRKIGTRAAQAISKVSVALFAQLQGATIVELRLAAGSVAETPVRLSAVEDSVRGRACDAQTAELAASVAASCVAPIDDVRSSAAYRRHVLASSVRRLLLEMRG